MTEISLGMNGFFELYGLLFFTALFLSILLTPMTIRLAAKLGVHDVPNDRSMHSLTKTRLGGLGMATALGIAILLFLPLDAFIRGFLAGLLVIVAVGLIDDIYQIRASRKMLGQIVAAVVFILVSGKTIVSMGGMFGVHDLQLGILEWPVTIFCIVGFINALNLSDGLDGLAGGISAIAAVFIAGLAIKAGDGPVLGVLLALIGAIIGFLRFNSFPAKLFMGDTGSLFLGYSLAASSVSLLSEGATQGAGKVLPVTLLIILAIPLFDTTFVMTRRALKGVSPFHPDKTHLHHKLIAIGVPHGGVVSILYIGMFLFGLLAILARPWPEWIQLWLTLSIGVLFYLVISLLLAGRLRFPVETVERISEFDHRLMGHLRQILWHSTRPLGIVTILVLVLPLLLVDMAALKWGWVMLLFLGVMILFFPWLRTQTHKGFFHGTLYLAIFLLILFYQVFVVPAHPWFGDYLIWSSLLIAIWIGLKLLFWTSDDLIHVTGYEVFALVITWALPVAILPAIVAQQHEYVIEATWRACLQAVPFLVMLRVFLTNEPRSRRAVVTSFLLAFIILGIKILPSVF